MKKGFTLIELLVVVLIIGILAAVALPQYTKVLEKSRVTQSIAYVNALTKSAEAYYLANGVYPEDVRDIDLDITQGGTIQKSTLTAGEAMGVLFPSGIECMTHTSAALCLNRKNHVGVLVHYSQSSHPYAGKLSCGAYSNSIQAEQICLSMGGEFAYQDKGVKVYSLQ